MTIVNLMQEQLEKMTLTGKLFRANIQGDVVWDTYIKSFDTENNPKFRDPLSSEKNCNHCKNFMRRYGNIVAIGDNNEIITLFDVEADEEYRKVAKALSALISNSAIKDVFFETFNELNSLPYESTHKNNLKFQLGMAENVKRYNGEEARKYGVVKENEVRTFKHLHLSVDRAFVDTSGASVDTIMGGMRDSKNVFQKAMDTISVDTLELVRDLIVQGSLLDGTTHLHKVEAIIPLKKQYDTIPATQRDAWCWKTSYKFQFARFKNELIGVLCTELAEGEELNKACINWNKRVDPANYMKVSAPITKKQIEEAKKFVEENGYVESFDRRMATIDDIKVDEILHSNVGDGSMKKVSIFDGVKSSSTRHKRSEFDGVEEVAIEKFMTSILPKCSAIEVFFSNRHQGNLVSLTTSNSEESKPIFKWNNNYSWTFNGNLAGKSQIKEAVKMAGGRIEGVLRFSITWNQTGNDLVDFDAHAQEPKGTHIYFSSNARGPGNFSGYGGNLDVDMICPRTLGVENIVWVDKNKMGEGAYELWVHHYSGDGGQGFKAEIEMEGETFSYSCNSFKSGTKKVATVVLKDGIFNISHHMTEELSAHQEVYGLETNQFQKVNLVCLSPNHWGENKVGNKHYMFMLDGCYSPTSIRGFHNENLIPELAAHRKVLEVLGATNMVESKKKQLSGLGFNATVRDELIVKLQGTHKRTIKIKF